MTPRDEVLITAQEVLQHQHEGSPLLLLDCRFDLANPHAGELSHAEQRPVGAVYAHLNRDLSAAPGPDPRSASFTGRHPLPDRRAFAQTMGRWGMVPETLVVPFDAQGSVYASRAWWMLRWMGHPQVRVLDGGMAAWLRAGGATESGPPKAPAAAAPYPPRNAGMTALNAQALATSLSSVRLVDARASNRFRGQSETLDPVAGHIPGALNWPFANNLDALGEFLPSAALRDAWQKLLGVGPESPLGVVHQCGSGVTACQNMLAMMAAGWPASTLYPGSWSEWSADPSRAIARGA
jgi:thiosulfate/3-mercaptopyruvate sulfurtransferase